MTEVKSSGLDWIEGNSPELSSPPPSFLPLQVGGVYFLHFFPYLFVMKGIYLKFTFQSDVNSLNIGHLNLLQAWNNIKIISFFLL